MNRKRLLIDYVIGIATIIAGGAVAKFLSLEAGVAVVGAGGVWIGRLFKQPEYVKG